MCLYDYFKGLYRKAEMSKAVKKGMEKYYEKEKTEE